MRNVMKQGVRISQTMGLDPAMLEVIFEFQRKYKDEGVKTRDPADVELAFREGMILMVQDLDADELKGVLAAYPRPGPTANPNDPNDYDDWEIGSVRIVYPRFGLQTVAMKLMSTHLLHFAPVENTIFAVTTDTNTPSIKGITRAGFAAEPRDLNPDFYESFNIGVGKTGYILAEDRLGQNSLDLYQIQQTRRVIRPGSGALPVVFENVPLFDDNIIEEDLKRRNLLTIEKNTI